MRNDPALPIIVELTAKEFRLAPELLEWTGGGRETVKPRLVAMALCCEFMRDLEPKQLRETFNAQPTFARYAGRWLRDSTDPEVKATANRLRAQVKAALAD